MAKISVDSGSQITPTADEFENGSFFQDLAAGFH